MSSNTSFATPLSKSNTQLSVHVAFEPLGKNSNNNKQRPVVKPAQQRRKHVSYDQHNNTSPEWGASCLSRAFMVWFYPILQEGTRRTLNQSDLGDIHPQDDPELAYERFSDAWDRERASRPSEKPRMARVLGNFLGVSFMAQLVGLYAMQATFNTFIPFLTKALIDTLTFEDDAKDLDADQLADITEINSVNNVIVLDDTFKLIAVIAIALFPFLGGFCYSSLQLLSQRASMHIYSALTTAIYRKSLVLSPAKKGEIGTGKIVNLMTSDANRSLARTLNAAYQVFVVIPQLIVLMFLLYQQIGLASLIGVGITIVVIPVNSVLMKKIQKLYKEIMVATDHRVKLVNELFSSIRVIKMYAWEAPMLKNLFEARQDELRRIRKHAYVHAIGNTSFLMQVPNILQMAVFVGYYYMGQPFLPSVVFTAIQLLQLIRGPLRLLPTIFTTLTQSSVALDRIANFLLEDEIQVDPNDVRTDSLPGQPAKEPVINLQDASFAWTNPNDAALPDAKEESTASKLKRGVNNPAAQVSPVVNPSESSVSVSVDVPTAMACCNVSIFKGELVAVIGPVGQGKTALVMSILGETYKLGGRVSVQSSVSYAPQQGWLVNASLKDNILFGSTYNYHRYQKTLEACALVSDIDSFENGDEIMIGERGINLSGGQNARVNLARAVYADTDLVVLDDPLAAVDAHVGNHIFRHCIKGVLKHRTRLLVTNQVHRLKHVDRILYVNNGQIEFQGTYAQLVASGVDFSFSARAEPEEAPALENDDVAEARASVRRSVARDSARFSDAGTVMTFGGEAPESEEDDQVPDPAAGKVLYTEEKRAEGLVKATVFKYYMATIGSTMITLTVVLSAIYLFLPMAGQYLLAYFTDEEACLRKEALLAETPDGNETVASDDGLFQSECTNVGGDLWITLYWIAMVSSLVFCVWASLVGAEARVKSAKVFHNNLTYSMIRAPVSFYDVTPLGRILNRFSGDMSQIDNSLTQTLLATFLQGLMVLVAFVAIAIPSKGLFLVMLIPLGLLYNVVYQKCRTSGLQIQRMSSVTLSPVYSHFTESLAGISTIRAYNQQLRFQEGNKKLLKTNLVPRYLIKGVFPAWMTITLNALTSIIIGGVAAFVVYAGFVSAGEAGFAISYAINASQSLYMMVFLLTEAEVSMNAVERLKEYSEDIEQEAPVVVADTQPAQEWPANGEIVVKDLVAGYRDGPDVLHGVSFRILPREKVGIVGRTGSGKSSLMQVLLRMIEPRGGSMHIDGVDIAKIGLQVLRTKLSIIPQNATCFVGTLRYNLDPFNQHTDQAVWQALEQVKLKGFVSGLPLQLQEEIVENGSNLSMGQRQLLAIARAILRPSRILLLDEATASVDKGTDVELQSMIRTSFKDRTVLTIAHRLNTILDSSRIMVLSDGNVVEFDTPRKLMQNKNGFFYKLNK